MLDIEETTIISTNKFLMGKISIITDIETILSLNIIKLIVEYYD